jgi:hypothetical protein
MPKIITFFLRKVRKIMTTHDIMDDICSINTTAEKAKAVIDYLFNQYSDRYTRDDNQISYKELSCETAQTFLSIAFDYINEIYEVSNKLCQLKISDIKTDDQSSDMAFR